MSTVAQSIENSFKALVAEKPYKSITVKEICEGAFISRRTFYANFVDKRAVIAYLLRRDAFDPASRALELLEPDEIRDVSPIVFSRLYQGVADNQEFYQDLVRPMAGVDPTFELVAARAMKSALEKLARRFNPHIDQDRLKRVAYYHAAGSAILLERWIYDGCETSVDELGKMHASIIVPSLEPLIMGSLF